MVTLFGVIVFFATRILPATRLWSLGSYASAERIAAAERKWA
jgi:hypothetical protein